MAFAHKTRVTHFKKDKGRLLLYSGEYSAKQEDAISLPYDLTIDNTYDFKNTK